MPKRYQIEIQNDIETRDTPLNTDNIAPAGLPPAYGSRDDLRHDGTTVLHSLPEELAVTDDTHDDILDEYLEIRPPSETPRFAPDKQIFYAQTPIDVDLNTDIPFKAQTVRIDNYTNHWVFVQQLRRWIPPDWYGAVFNATGLLSITLTWQAPPGLVQPAPTANTIVTVIAHLERCPEVAGTKRT